MSAPRNEVIYSFIWPLIVWFQQLCQYLEMRWFTAIPFATMLVIPGCVSTSKWGDLQLNYFDFEPQVQLCQYLEMRWFTAKTRQYTCIFGCVSTSKWGDLQRERGSIHRPSRCVSTSKWGDLQPNDFHFHFSLAVSVPRNEVIYSFLCTIIK